MILYKNREPRSVIDCSIEDDEPGRMRCFLVVEVHPRRQKPPDLRHSQYHTRLEIDI